MEVEAVLAVYGDDCAILDSLPPHLHLHIKPRTVDFSSQQRRGINNCSIGLHCVFLLFVEAVIGIKASPEYPSEPLHIDLIESKGLDGERQKQLITSGQHKACELSSCLMLVALCEEVLEKLSVMNHPDGDCPLCLYPLVPDNEQHEALPFMKLMSCFRCFQSECIVRDMRHGKSEWYVL
ncbi:hypothetical protein NC652_032523 [Populus alba x Populus x berolinensis]|nr:hypothetical protein NC652_032523 [Populus alba x Populus x berolinensis]